MVAEVLANDLLAKPRRITRISSVTVLIVEHSYTYIDGQVIGM